MTDKKNLYLRNLSFLINIFIIFFIWFISFKTNKMILELNVQRDFLETINKIPIHHDKMILANVSLFSLFCFLTYLRKISLPKKTSLINILTVIDLLICFLILYFTNFSHKGILFLAISNMILYLHGKKKYLVITITILMYIFIDYDILSSRFSLFSINNYIEMYNASEKIFFYSLRNILYSLNEVLFILFLIFSIRIQIEEAKKINVLYGKLEKAYSDLKIANMDLEIYSKETEEIAKIKERNRLSREIHDTLGHTITGVVMGIGASLEIIEVDIEKTKLQLEKVLQLSRKGLQEVRTSVNELRPDALSKQPLTKALDNMVNDINSFTKTKVNLNIVGIYKKLQDDEEQTVYRVVQESITNAIRHGEPKVIDVTLSFNENDITLKIVDNGSGCKNFIQGFGTRHIKERIELLNGEVNFTCLENGFKVFAKIPMRW